MAKEDPSATKQRAKQVLRRTVGEPYVGKRLKLRNLARVMPTLDLDPRSILDAGAEDATFVYWLADRFPNATVTALDIDQDAVEACRQVMPRSYAGRVAFEVGSFDSLKPEQFDLITAFDVLEHIRDDVHAVRDFFRALRPGGVLLVHVPRDVWTHRDGRRERVPDAEAWRINAGHVRQGYSPEGLRHLVEGAGFEVRTVDTWLRRWGVTAHAVYRGLERPTPLRLLTLPFTDVAAWMDRRRPADEGNTVWLEAVRA